MSRFFSILPPAASSVAPQVDGIFRFVLGATTVLGVLVFSFMIFFCWRYRAGERSRRGAGVINEKFFEVIWITVPLILTLTIFGVSVKAYYGLYVPPREATDVYVVAKQWMWRFYVPGGTAEIGHLHLPVNKPVRLLMTSEDVIHSFFVPDFRVKQDVLPARYSSVWFTPTQLGHFHVLCTQYCGMNHAAMDAWIDVSSAQDYEAWRKGATADHGLTSAVAESEGRAVYARHGCASCHDAGSRVPAPSLVHLFGAPVELADGGHVVADENYIRESIFEPNAKVVRGYGPIMPSYAGQVSEEEIVELVNYIRSLGGNP